VKLELWTCGTAGRPDARPDREAQGRKIFTRRVAALVMVAHRTLCRSNEVSRWRGADRGGASTARAGAAGRGGADRGRRERPGGGKAVPGVADVSEPLAAGGRAALASKGAGGARCKLTPAQLRELEAVLDAGPAVWGWQDQCWTLARIGELVRERFEVDYTLAGLDVLLHRIGWSVQVPARRAAERDEDQIARWREETWPVIKGRRRTWAPGSASRTSPARA
jgi:transposase